jgi:hypothetical protein
MGLVATVRWMSLGGGRSAAAPWGSDPDATAIFPTPIAAKLRAVPVDERLRTDDGQNLEDRRKPAVKHDQQPAILVREPDTALEPAPQNS